MLSSAHFLAPSVHAGGAVPFDDSLKSQSTCVRDEAVYQSEERGAAKVHTELFQSTFSGLDLL